MASSTHGVGGNSPRAIVYTRFSPRPDAATSESCEIQRQQCGDYARQKGLQVVATFDDPDVSGADEFRPQLDAAICALKKGDILLVYKLDRLARNLYLAETIRRAVAKRGARIEAVSGDVEGEGPEQVLIRQVCAAIAEYERKAIGRRTSDALRAKLKKGCNVSSRPPYGYSLDPDNPKRLIVNPAEQKICEMILELHRKGCNNNQITNMLPPEMARQGHWHPQIVRNITKRLLRP